jgi:hypothetical protein
LYQRNNTYINELKCEIFPSGAKIGDAFLFRVTAYNIQGSVTSVASAKMYLASVPSKPKSAPVSDATITSGSQIKVDYEVIGEDGGLPLLSYELQMSAPTLDNFVSLAGRETFTLTTFFVVSLGVEKGAEYAFRYRGINQVGAGDWSDLVIVRAASVPAAPPKPVYLSSTSTTITLQLFETADNGGSKITGYTLERDAGDLASQIDIQAL